MWRDNGRIIRRVNADALGHFSELISGSNGGYDTPINCCHFFWFRYAKSVKHTGGKLKRGIYSVPYLIYDNVVSIYI